MTEVLATHLQPVVESKPGSVGVPLRLIRNVRYHQMIRFSALLPISTPSLMRASLEPVLPISAPVLIRTRIK